MPTNPTNRISGVGGLRPRRRITSTIHCGSLHGLPLSWILPVLSSSELLNATWLMLSAGFRAHIGKHPPNSVFCHPWIPSSWQSKKQLFKHCDLNHFFPTTHTLYSFFGSGVIRPSTNTLRQSPFLSWLRFSLHTPEQAICLSAPWDMIMALS